MSRAKQPTRAERDRAAAQRANAEIRAARFRELTVQAVEPRRYVSGAATTAGELQKSDGLPRAH